MAYLKATGDDTSPYIEPEQNNKAHLLHNEPSEHNARDPSTKPKTTSRKAKQEHDWKAKAKAVMGKRVFVGGGEMPSWDHQWPEKRKSGRGMKELSDTPHEGTPSIDLHLGQTWKYTPPAKGSVQKHCRALAQYLGFKREDKDADNIKNIETLINDCEVGNSWFGVRYGVMEGDMICPAKPKGKIASKRKAKFPNSTKSAAQKDEAEQSYNNALTGLHYVSNSDPGSGDEEDKSVAKPKRKIASKRKAKVPYPKKSAAQKEHEVEQIWKSVQARLQDDSDSEAGSGTDEDRDEPESKRRRI